MRGAGVREVRLLPIVLVATVSLLGLKTLALIAGRAPAPATVVAAAAPPTQTDAPDVEITGSSAAKSEPKPDAKPKAEPPPPSGKVIPTAPDESAPPPGEKVVLQRLQERRQELETRARELEMREGLLKAAENRLDARLQELKATEARITAAKGERDDAEKQRLKGLIVMYESMRAKDAARIFDRLDVKLLVEVASLMNPRKVADVMAQMQPEAAERLTVELAARRGGGPGDLPKIEGRRL